MYDAFSSVATDELRRSNDERFRLDKIHPVLTRVPHSEKYAGQVYAAAASNGATSLPKAKRTTGPATRNCQSAATGKFMATSCGSASQLLRVGYRVFERRAVGDDEISCHEVINKEGVPLSMPE